MDVDDFNYISVSYQHSGVRLKGAFLAFVRTGRPETSVCKENATI